MSVEKKPLAVGDRVRAREPMMVTAISPDGTVWTMKGWWAPAALERIDPTDVYGDIQRERETQDAQWGGPDHDDAHSVEDFVEFIGKHARRAVGGDSRHQMVRVAALAVACIESLDRRKKQREAWSRATHRDRVVARANALWPDPAPPAGRHWLSNEMAAGLHDALGLPRDPRDGEEPFDEMLSRVRALTGERDRAEAERARAVALNDELVDRERVRAEKAEADLAEARAQLDASETRRMTAVEVARDLLTGAAEPTQPERYPLWCHESWTDSGTRRFVVYETGTAIAAADPQGGRIRRCRRVAVEEWGEIGAAVVLRDGEYVCEGDEP